MRGDIQRGDLYRLPRAPHRRVFAKLFHLLVRLAAAGLQHRPVRAGRYGVHANASFRHLFSQRFSEDRETGFGLRIIEQDRAGFIRLHRGGIDNRASGPEVRQCGAGDPERRVDVGFKGSVEIFGSEFLKGFTVLLTPGVINRMLRPPSCSTASATSDWQKDSERISPGRATAVRPSALIRAITSSASFCSSGR